MVPRSSVRVGRSTSARKNSSDRLKGAEFFGREMSSPSYDARWHGWLFGGLAQNDIDNSRPGARLRGSDRERL
jgi:hypothetical protein